MQLKDFQMIWKTDVVASGDEHGALRPAVLPALVCAFALFKFRSEMAIRLTQNVCSSPMTGSKCLKLFAKPNHTQNAEASGQDQSRRDPTGQKDAAQGQPNDTKQFQLVRWKATEPFRNYDQANAHTARH